MESQQKENSLKHLTLKAKLKSSELCTMTSPEEDPEVLIVHGIKKSPGRGAEGILPKPPVTSRPGSNLSIASDTPLPSVQGKLESTWNTH